MKKILIAYFSQKGETYVNGSIEVRQQGNTEVIAYRLAEKLDADLFHIEKVGGYPETYKGMVDIAKVEWHHDLRPEIVGKVARMNEYDTIILGYPNWCNTMPKAVCTFLESYKFKGKTIIPYCTNEGSGLGDSIEDLKNLCPNSFILPGTSIHGADVHTVTDEVERIIAFTIEGSIRRF